MVSSLVEEIRCLIANHSFHLRSFADGSSNIREPNLSACFVPDHKAAMILFLERVYGIDSPVMLVRLMEVGLLPDMKAAAQLDTVSIAINALVLIVL